MTCFFFNIWPNYCLFCLFYFGSPFRSRKIINIFYANNIDDPRIISNAQIQYKLSLKHCDIKVLLKHNSIDGIMKIFRI